MCHVYVQSTISKRNRTHAINASHVCKFEVSGSNIRKCEKGAHNINFNEIFYLTKYIKNVIMSIHK